MTRTHRALIAIVFIAAALAASTAVAQNPLPAPNHPIGFGYYGADSKYGSYFTEVSCYTNLVRIGPDDFSADDPNWPNLVATALARAYNANKRLYISLAMTNNCDAGCNVIPAEDIARIDATLQVAAPYWSNVDFIELADEPDWAPAKAINAHVNAVNARLDAFGLAHKPLGAVFQVATLDALPPASQGNRIVNSTLDWVGIEAYVDAPESSANSCDNIALLNQKVNTAKAALSGKSLVLVMQSYDRNGCWLGVNSMSNLVDLQNATYMLAYNDTAVAAVTMFSYGRESSFGGCFACEPGNPGHAPCGGAHLHPELANVHRQIGQQILGYNGQKSCAPSSYVPLPSCGGGGGVPNAPSNLQASAQMFTVTLTWNDNSSDESSFKVQRMDNNSGVWNLVATVGANTRTYSETLPAPPSGGSNSYSYRVKAINGSGASAFSNTASTTLYAEAPSAAPLLIGPVNCITTARPTYSWNAVAKATRYYLAATRVDVEDFFINDPNVIGTSYPSPGDLIPGVQYRWKAKACNNIGCSGYAPSMYFTPFCAPTTPPTMLSPKDCVGTRRPTITWSSVPGATGYKIAIFSVVDVTNDVLVYYVDVAGTSYTPPANLVAGQEYRAKVKAINNGASGPFSAHRYFTPMCSATQKAGSASPIAPNAATPNQTPTFTWESASNAGTYTLYVRTSAGTLVTQTTYSAASICSPTECSVPSPAVYTTGGYYWQVLSSNAYGSSWSANAAFSTP